MNKTARNWKEEYDIGFVSQIDETNLQSMQEGARKMMEIVNELIEKDEMDNDLDEAKTNFENVLTEAEDAEEAMEYFDWGLGHLYDYGDMQGVFLGTF